MRKLFDNINLKHFYTITNYSKSFSIFTHLLSVFFILPFMNHCCRVSYVFVLRIYEPHKWIVIRSDCDVVLHKMCLHLYNLFGKCISTTRLRRIFGWYNLRTRFFFTIFNALFKKKGYNLFFKTLPIVSATFIYFLTLIRNSIRRIHPFFKFFDFAEM